MQLDDLAHLASLDRLGWRTHIDAWPDQLAAARALARGLGGPAGPASGPVLIAGRGDSAIAGDLARLAAGPAAARPVLVWDEDGLPPWAGPDTTVIALSHSGRTPATLAAAEAARARGAALLAITSGGPLAALPGAVVWRYPEAGVPDGLVPMAVLTLAALEGLGLAAGVGAAVEEAEAELRRQQTALRAESPVARNPAKRMAGQLLNRVTALFVSDDMAPAGRWWQSQINQRAKAWATSLRLAESDHAVAGRGLPEAHAERTMALFLRGAAPCPASDSVRTAFLTAGYNTDGIAAVGQGRLAQLFTLAHYGSYVALYLAACYGLDPGAAPG